MTKLLLSLLAIASLARADFDAPHWRLRKTIGPNANVPLSTIRADAEIFRGSPEHLDDVRIVRNATEIPYILQTLYGHREDREFQPAISNQSTTSEGIQATLDLGVRAQHNRVRIATRRVNFKQRVRIETSDDAEHWAVARDDGFIFDFSEGDRHAAVLTVEYPLSTRRYVRITIMGWTNPTDLTSAWLTYRSGTNGVRDVLANVTPAVVENAKEQDSVWTADIGFAGVPHDQVQVDVEPGLFYRSVEIESSRDAKAWLYVGQGTISRTAGQESLSLSFPEQWERYLRVRVHNGDSAPVKVRQFAFSAYRRVLKFPTNAAGQYWIYYGNPDAKRPSYDLAQVMPVGVQVVDASLGAEGLNPAYRPPVEPQKPWSDRHPQVLYAVLGLAVLGMGYLAVRFLLKVRPAGAPGD
jgi:hypothetical protein